MLLLLLLLLLLSLLLLLLLLLLLQSFLLLYQRRTMAETRTAQTEGVRDMAGHVFPPLPLELQAYRWNDVVLVFNPLQLFVQVGLEVKRRSRHRYTFPVCFTGGGMSPYIGPAEDVALGGYHFTQFEPGRWAPGNAARLIDDMVALANTC